jgi:hypothetical protein
MHARLVTITGTDVDAAVKFIGEQVAPMASQQKGFRQLTAAGDRSRGVLSALTLWESRDDLDASESGFAKARQEVLDASGGQLTVEVFEQVAWQTAATPPGPGSVLQTVVYKTDPARVEDQVAWFKIEVLPAIMARAGVRGARNLVNRETGKGRISVVYSDRASLDAATGDRTQRMATARGRGFQFGEEAVLDVLYARAATT